MVTDKENKVHTGFMFSACGKRHAQSVGFVHIFLTVLVTMGSKQFGKELG